MGIEGEGGGRAQGDSGVYGTVGGNTKQESNRKSRIKTSLEFSRRKSDKYIHRIRSSEREDEFYELNPSTDPEVRIAQKLVDVESGVPMSDDVTNPKYNTDW